VADAETGLEVSLSLATGMAPEPVIDGARATFPGIAPDTDLVVEIRPTGYEYFLVLHTPAAAKASKDLSLEFSVSGGSIVEGLGGWQLVSDRGEVIGLMPPAVAWDAYSDLIGGSPVLDEWSAQPEYAPVARVFEGVALEDRVTIATEFLGSGRDLQAEEKVPLGVDLAPSGERGAYAVTLGLNEEWAQDPATEYPLVLDPAGIWGSAFDTDVINGYTSDSNSTQVRIGTWDAGSHVARTYFNFSTPSMLEYATVTSASLYLWEFYSFSCNARNWQAYRSGLASTSTQPGNEPAIGDYGGTSSGTTGYSSSCTANWVSIPMTEMVQEWSEAGVGTFHGVMLRAENQSDSYGWKRFNSREASGGNPTMYVEFTTVPPLAPTNITVGEETLSAGHPTIPTSTTPTFSATVTDAENPPGGARNLFAVFVLFKDGAIVGTYNGSTVGSGEVSTWTPTTGLAEGPNYTVLVAAAYNDWTVSPGTNGGGTFTIESVNPPNTPTSLMINGFSAPSGVEAPGVAVTPTQVALQSLAIREIIEPGDVNGDNFNDLLYWRTDYSLWLVLGDGEGGVLNTVGTPVPGNWANYNMIIGPGDFDGDGNVDLIIRTPSNSIYLYKGAGDGTFTLDASPIGTGWSFRDILTPGDFDNNTYNDLIAFGTNGNLYFYGRDATGWKSGYGSVIGTGWQSFTSVLTPGNFNDDSYNAPDLIGWTKSTGALRFYYGTGGGVSGGTTFSTAWSAPVQVVAPGDFTGNGTMDLLALNADGTLTAFEGTGTAGIAATGNQVLGPDTDLEELVLTDSRPSLSAVVSDPDGGQVRAVFALYRKTGGEEGGYELVRDNLYGTWVTSGQRSYFRGTSTSSEPGLEAALLVGGEYRIEVRSQDLSRLSDDALKTGTVTVPAPVASPEVPSGCDSTLGVHPTSGTTCGGV
jgi:hypothetical protein